MATGQRVSVQINGLWVRDLVVMKSQYAGFCRLATRRFQAGATIAFKSKDRLTAEEKKIIFGSGTVYPLTILWDEASDSPVGSSGTIKHTAAPKGQQPKFKPTDYQLQILHTVLSDGTHVEIKAYAGTGKTATLVWVVMELKELGKLPQRVIYLAFNASIQEELAARLQGTGCPARTTHSFGYSAIKNVFGERVQLDNRRYGNFFLQMMCDDLHLPYCEDNFKTVRKQEQYQLRSAVLEMASYIQNWAIVPQGGYYSPQQIELCMDLFHQYEIEIPLNKDGRPIAAPDDVVRYATRLVTRGIPKEGEKVNIVSFDDMLYLPIALNLPLSKQELVLTDETQDFNACQVAMLKRFADDGARIVFVGDPNQALYRFRGADSRAFEKVGLMLEGTARKLTRHSLPKSWRNAKRIIQHCRKWVSDFDTYREEMGTVETISFGQALERANNERQDIVLPDGINGAPRALDNCSFAFLCRVNVPLIVTAYQLIGMGKRVCIIGKTQMGEPLKRLIYDLCNIEPKKEKWVAGDAPRPASDNNPAINRISDMRDGDGNVVVRGLLSRLNDYYAAQAEKFTAEGLEGKLEKLQQDVQCLEVICTRSKEDTAVGALCEIDNLFSDDPQPGVIQLATIHRAKGLEWNVTFMLRPDLLPFPKATHPEDIYVEQCCCYVGYSRAKDRSYLVADWPFGNASRELSFEQPETVLDYPGEEPQTVTPQAVFASLAVQKQFEINEVDDDGEPF